jgi:hypothetical protein
MISLRAIPVQAISLGAHAVSAPHGTWYPYVGSARIVLALVLVVVAAAIMYLGTRLRLPVRLPRPSQPLTLALFVTWFLAIAAFLVCLAIYVAQLQHEHAAHAAHAAPANPITPVTDLAVVVTFLVILLSSRRYSRGTRLAGAVIGAIVAPMIFELPFDLIVMARTYPPVLPDPAAYRVLFFAPLFLIELTTLALLTLSPLVRVRRLTFFGFALMLAVFAVWAVPGFDYPSTPLPTALNMVSKLIAFATALTLFLPVSAPSPDDLVDASLADASPVDASPVDASRAGGSPVDASPVDASPADASPVDASPADASPAGGFPAGGFPAGGFPAGGSPAGGSPAGASSVRQESGMMTA